MFAIREITLDMLFKLETKYKCLPTTCCCMCSSVCL